MSVIASMTVLVDSCKACPMVLAHGNLSYACRAVETKAGQYRICARTEKAARARRARWCPLPVVVRPHGGGQ